CACLDDALCQIGRVQVPDTVPEVPPHHHVLKREVLPHFQNLVGAECRCEDVEDWPVDGVAAIVSLSFTQASLCARKCEQINHVLLKLVPNLYGPALPEIEVLADVGFCVDAQECTGFCHLF